MVSGGKASFVAVADARTRVLILGSLPGEASLSRGQYYAHPQNQFWRLVGAVIGLDLVPLAYEDRLAALNGAGIGVWDVIRSAERIGSLDVNIRNHIPNALETFIASLPALRAVGFNGAKASQIGRKEITAEGGPSLITLPSSSPAHAVPFERKRTEWMRLKLFLETQAP